MNKSGLVAEVAKRTDRNRAEIAEVLDQTMAVIRETVSKGERVSLVGFGTFDKRKRGQRTARNPRKPEVPIVIPARVVPAFNPGQAFKEAVAEKKRRPAKKSAAKRTRR